MKKDDSEQLATFRKNNILVIDQEPLENIAENLSEQLEDEEQKSEKNNNTVQPSDSNLPANF